MHIAVHCVHLAAGGPASPGIHPCHIKPLSAFLLLQIPVILAITPEPSIVSAGQLFGVNVTLQEPISGSVLFTSDPPGILCQGRELTNAKSVSSICSTPQTTAAMAAVVASEGRGAVAAASTTQAQAAQQLSRTTTQYTLTAIVTADTTATASTTVEVSRHQAWGCVSKVHLCLNVVRKYCRR